MIRVITMRMAKITMAMIITRMKMMRTIGPDTIMKVNLTIFNLAINKQVGAVGRR